MPADNSNGAAPTLRDIAEAAYDEVESNAIEAEQADTTTAEPSEPSEGSEPLAQDARPRDKSGRWVSRQPGEAVEPLDPAPKQPPQQKVSGTQAPAPDPAAAQAAKSNQAPEHWSAEDKATFGKLPQEGQAFLLKRHGEMEAEFTRKSQASAGAVQFTQALAPVFNDAKIVASLKQSGLNPVQAVHEWARLHRMGISERQEDKFALLVDLTQRMGLDPARIFSALQNQPSQVVKDLPPEAQNDPAVKFIAEHLGRLSNENAALRGDFQRMRDAEVKAREEMGLKSARQGIDSFADEVDSSGQPLRPYFNAVLPIILDLFRANPNRELADAYDAACWAHPEVRKQLLAAEQQRQRSQSDIARARVAVRGNARGVTAPASRPQTPTGPSKGGIRDAIEQSADELGY